MPEAFQKRRFACSPLLSISSSDVKGVVMGNRMPRRLSGKRPVLEVAVLRLSEGLFKRRDYNAEPSTKVSAVFCSRFG